jgi:hypothetical protein
MKRFVIREVETLKTTAAFYGCNCCCQTGCWQGWCCNPDGSITFGGN